MKSGDLEKKLKTAIRKHYVRKTSFDKLKKRCERLEKRLARLEKTRTPAPADKPKKNAKVGEKAAAQAPAEKGDELTRIKGIGPVLQGKLNKLGIRDFAQIAAWSPADVARISEHLDFKGRIEREEWIQQARDIM